MDISFVLRKFRKSIAAFTAVAMLSTLVSFSGIAYAGTFSDVPESHFAYEGVEALYAMNVVQGYAGTGTYGVNDNVTRAQLAKILVLASAGEDAVDPDYVPEGGLPSDISLTEWEGTQDDYIRTAMKLGIMSGYGGDRTGQVGPNDNVDRAQAATMMVRAFSLETMDVDADFGDDPQPEWAADNIATAWYWQVIDGYDNGDFGAADYLTRGQAGKMTYNAMNPEARDLDQPSDEDSGLTVEVSDMTPDGITVPKSATAVAMASWDLTANDGDVVVNGLTVYQYGVSTMYSDHQAYIYHGDNRISSGVSVNSSTKKATFNNLDLEIEEGDTETVTLRLDVGATGTASTKEVAFQIASADDVNTTADVNGSFPAKGEVFTVSTEVAGTVKVEKNGTITNPNVADTDVTIAKFKLTTSESDGALQNLGLYLTGSVSADDVENFNLYLNGEAEPLATVENVDSEDVIRFVLDGDYSDIDGEDCLAGYTGYCVEEGNSRSFYVTADFNTGRSADTVKVYVDERADVYMEDFGFGGGYGMTVNHKSTDTLAGSYDGTSCTSSSGDCSYSTLEGGEVTFQEVEDPPSKVATNADNANFQYFSVTSMSDVTFNDFTIQVTPSSLDATADAAGLLNAAGASNLTEITVEEVGGGHIWGPIDADDLTATFGGAAISTTTDGDVSYYQFTDDLDLAAGETKEFMILANVANNASLSGETFKFGVYISSTEPEIKDVTNKIITNSTDVVPSSPLEADTVEIETNSLSVTRNSGVGSKTEVIGTSDAVLAGFNFGAGAASDITVSSLTVTGYIDDNGATGTLVAGVDTVKFNEVVSSMNLYVGSVSEENKVNGSAASADAVTGEATFNNLDWVIPADQSVTLLVTGNVNNNETYATDTVKVDIATMSTDVIAENEDGDTVVSASSDTPNGGVSGNGTSYTIITVSAGGTLSVDVDSNTRSSQIVVAGTSDNEFSTLRFEATQESFWVQEFSLRNGYSAAVGDYDDNITTLYVTYYTDEAQTVEETKACENDDAGVAGVYDCSGLNLVVPDSDLAGVPDYAQVWVTADLASVADSLADEGDKPVFTLSLTGNQFDAEGLDSDKDIDASGTNDLVITDLTGVTPVTATVAINSAALGASSTTLTVDTADATGKLVPGDFITTSGTTASTEIMYVTAVNSATSITVVRGVAGTTASANTVEDNDTINVYGTADAILDTLVANYMQVQATDLDLTVASSSREGQPSSAEAVLTMSATANSAKAVKLRTGLGNGDAGYGDEVAANITAIGATEVSQPSATPTPVEGTKVAKFMDSAADLDANDGAALYAGATGLMDDHKYASLWVYINDDNTTNDFDSYEDISFIIGTTAAADHAYDLGAVGNGPSTYVEEAWVFFYDIDITNGVVVGASDAYFGVKTDVAANEADDYIAFDDVRFYNERLNVDLTLNEAWATTTNPVAYLLHGTQTVAVGYLDMNGAASTAAGQIVFVPSGTYGDISIDGTKELIVKMNTSTTIADAADATERLTARVDLGNVSTDGDVFWYDGAGTIKFLGVNAVDRVEVTTTY